MKKIIIIVCSVLMFSPAYSQRTLEWSIGEPQVECGKTIQICFPMYVSINNSSKSPILGTSTMRFFYDANYLTNLRIEEIQNGYSQSGLNQSAPVFGDVFGFSSNKGVFAQFNIIDNAAANPLYLKGKPVHVLDLCFDVTEIGKEDWAYSGTLSLPIVLDNNKLHGNSSRVFEDADEGYLVNDSGIVGFYFLNKDTTHAYAADDETSNNNGNGNSASRSILKSNKSFIGKVKRKTDRVGFFNNAEVKDQCRLYVEEQVLEANSSFTVFPVPFVDKITVRYHFDYDTKVRIQIFDLKGSLIYELENESYEKGVFVKEKIDLSKISNQLLLVKLITNSEVLNKKIVSATLKTRKQ